ncbi:hypothetical protein DEJ33_06695 [Curtobacterium sp. MCPF17_047]|uniref:hypothetical protein n=1 Tax=Curtobacterium sp. MCPF17_047 TaxID=2175654 RepID=UPI000DA9BD32|nr:hypothetical protein [Curtobacterium sp. MCPF17_047]PZF66953.1 hypothetical protein DEJ33_06695 [Curtobacterium sp. MCPF17_047]
MLPTMYRHVTDTGVTINYRQFDAEGLDPLRNTKSNIRRRNGRHEVKLDPYNPVKAWVADPKGGWIECTVRNEDALFYPHLEDNDFDLNDAETDRSDVAAVTAALAGAPLHTAIESTPNLPSTDPTDPIDSSDDDDDDVIYVLD